MLAFIVRGAGGLLAATAFCLVEPVLAGTPPPTTPTTDVDAAVADLCSGQPWKHQRGDRILAATPQVAIPRLRAGLESRAQHERARITWVLSRMGEPGRQAVIARGDVAFRDLLYLYWNGDRAGALDSLRQLKAEFLAFAMPGLGLPGSDPHPLVIARALADLREPSFAPALAACLSSEQADRAAGCAEALRGLDVPAATGALAAALGHRSPEVRKVATSALVDLGPAAVVPVCAAFRESSGDAERRREEAVRLLLRLGAAGEPGFDELGALAVPAVIRVALSDRDRVPAGAVRGEFKGRIDGGVWREIERHRAAAIPVLLSLLEHGDRGFGKVGAVRLLLELREPSAVAGLVAALRDTDPFTREVAVTALARLGGWERVAEVFEVTADPSRQVAEAAMWALVRMGPDAVPYLEAAAASTAPSASRRSALRALAYMGEPGLGALRRVDPVPASELLQSLDEACSDREYARPLAVAVRRVAGQEAARLLLARIGPTSVSSRTTEVLAQIASVPATSSDPSPFDVRSAVPLLLPELDDTCDWSRAIPAAHALGAIGDPAAVKKLAGVVSSRRRCSGWRGPHLPVLEAAAEALGEIGDRRGVSVLVAIVEDAYADPLARGAAARALARIGDPRGLRAAEEYRRDPQSQRRPTRTAIAWALAVLVGGPLGLLVAERLKRPPWVRWIFLGAAFVVGGGLGAQGVVDLQRHRAAAAPLFLFALLLLVATVGLRTSLGSLRLRHPAAAVHAGHLVHGTAFMLVGALLSFLAIFSASVLGLLFLPW